MYISTAVVHVQETELTQMLTQYRQNNERDNITGMLLYSGENYVQLIEGLEENLYRLLSKIVKDYHHTNVIKLADGPIQERLFGNWSMGFKAVAPEELSELKGFVNSLDPEFLHSSPKEEGSAINVLRQFARHNVNIH